MASGKRWWISATPIPRLHNKLSGEPALIEESLLVRCCNARERGVAMGEAAKARDDVSVDLRPFDEAFIARAFAQCDAARLVSRVLRMLER